MQKSLIKVLTQILIKKKNFCFFNLKPRQKIIIVKIKKNQSSLENEKIGAEFYNFVKQNSLFNFTLLENNILETNIKNKFFLEEFLHGAKLKNLIFLKNIKLRKKGNYEIQISTLKNKFNFFKKIKDLTL